MPQEKKKQEGRAFASCPFFIGKDCAKERKIAAYPGQGNEMYAEQKSHALIIQKREQVEAGEKKRGSQYLEGKGLSDRKLR